MARYRDFSDYRDYALHAILVLVALILLATNQNPQIESFKLWMVGLISEFQERWDSVKSYYDLKQKNEQLLLENTRLSLENSQMAEIKLENERLRELIAFKVRTPWRLIPARIVVKGQRGPITAIVLNVGTHHGVTKNMALVTGEGLVGRIYQAGPDQSIGHILLDRNFRVSAKIQRSRVDGIVSWEGGELCRLNDVPKRADVQLGDAVITSGYSEIFPAGIPIGTIVNIHDSPRALFLQIELKPSVDFQKLEEVFVVADLAKVE
ncbi:MAG: rod shape-determining protein MreC [candidate division KSB1 bacterium]|nr:rod shape-determining protein MreC [candidate division KSB1 bacterium]MDZ7334008.1 rod shape-determining protein MreC [candidate division KSB1 bacterium]MDZ7357443.1 rod shape-determining protein MreC [candidate division KSB1 bacterium]MDZ7399993.1 rod shape-determining protein MreC [candidate division KSB1 bacterium]